MTSFLVSARYATKRGRAGSCSATILADSIHGAITEMNRRLEKRGCSKIDLTCYGKD